MRFTRCRQLALALLLLLGPGCGEDATAPSDDAATGSDTTDVTQPDAVDAAAPEVTQPDSGAGDAPAPSDTRPPEPQPEDCDPLTPTYCALPWPSDLYLRPHHDTQTGLHLAFGPTTLPATIDGDHIDPKPYERLDGYGPSSALLVHFPGLDLSDLPSEGDLSGSLAPDAAIVWLAVGSEGQARRIPYWVELDAQNPDPDAAVLFVRPGVILPEATRQVIGIRGLTDGTGTPFPPSDAFRMLRDGDDVSQTPGLAGREFAFDETFEALAAAGVDRASLQLAWSWYTGSSQGIHGPMLQAADIAYAAVGDLGPELTVTSVDAYTPAENAEIGLDVKGTFRAPHFLVEQTHAVGTGWVLDRDLRGNVVQSGWRDAEFWVRIPHGALDGAGTPHGLLQYGHGLLGKGSQVKSGWLAKVALEHHMIVFACDWTGMASEDQSTAALAALDASVFPFLSERVHQGILESVLLARGIRERLLDIPEVAARGVTLAEGELYYYGNSQGGIYGGTYMGVSRDVHLALLGVPGNNYSTLLQRSVDFAVFLVLLKSSYADPTSVAIGLSAVQNLWDQVDPVSYYRHLEAAPFDGATRHVLLHQAKGDWQVATVTNEVAARSGLGVALMEHYGREVSEVTPTAYPHVGSALVSFDFGNPWQPPSNLPTVKDDLGDPHEGPRRLDHANEQMIHFFRSGGEVIDVCGGDGCTPD